MNLHKERYETMTLDEFEDYLPDCPADEKWELIGGRVVRMMVGARHDHHFIIQNINYALSHHFRTRGMPCRTYTETFRLRQKLLDLSVLPDIMVRCGAFDLDATSIDDPSLLFEVSSRGGVERDVFEKGGLYLQLPTLQHYVVVLRHPVKVLVWDRAEGGFRQRDPLSTLDGELSLATIDFTMSLRAIYQDIM